MKKTAVEWFANEIKSRITKRNPHDTIIIQTQGEILIELIEQAKEMERERKQKYLMAILDCRNLLKEINKTSTVGQTQINIKIFELENILNAEQYYKETFKSE
jgi:hypothetical protein